MDIPKEVRYPSCVFFSAMSSLGENVSYFWEPCKVLKKNFFHSKDHTVGFPQQKQRLQLSIMV